MTRIAAVLEARILFWLSAALDRVDPARLRRSRSRCSRACLCRRAAYRRSVAASAPAGACRLAVADRRRARRAVGDRREGRERARARLPARAAGADRRLRRLLGRDGRARTRGRRRRSCWSCRAAARSARRTPPCASAAGRSSRSPTPTRCGSPTPPARSSAPSPIPASATPAARSASCRPPSGDAAHQPGGRLLALRDGRARARVAPALDHRRQRRDLRDPPRGLHRGRPDHGPRPVAPVQHGQARLARRVRAGGARAARRWCRRSRASSRASGG